MTVLLRICGALGAGASLGDRLRAQSLVDVSERGGSVRVIADYDGAAGRVGANRIDAGAPFECLRYERYAFGRLEHRHPESYASRSTVHDFIVDWHAEAVYALGSPCVSRSQVRPTRRLRSPRALPRLDAIGAGLQKS